MFSSVHKSRVHDERFHIKSRKNRKLLNDPTTAVKTQNLFSTVRIFDREKKNWAFHTNCRVVFQFVRDARNSGRKRLGQTPDGSRPFDTRTLRVRRTPGREDETLSYPPLAFANTKYLPRPVGKTHRIKEVFAEHRMFSKTSGHVLSNDESFDKRLGEPAGTRAFSMYSARGERSANIRYSENGSSEWNVVTFTGSVRRRATRSPPGFDRVPRAADLKSHSGRTVVNLYTYYCVYVTSMTCDRILHIFRCS